MFCENKTSYLHSRFTEILLVENKVKNKVIFFLSLSILILVSCASTKEERPLWADDFTLEQVYPSSKYIARIGYSELEKNSTAYADSELSSYFSRKVKSDVTATQTLSDKKNESASDKTLTRTVNVQSVTELFAVNHTKPYFDKQSKKYICCAYINRQEAFASCEPKVQQAQKEFIALYNQAEKENDPFTKIKLLENCKPSAENYLSTLDFAHLLYEQGENKYISDRDLIGSIQEKIVNTKMNITMNVTVANDKDGKVSKKVSALLSNEGYVLTNKNYAYSVEVDVEQNKNVYSETVTADPTVAIKITNGKKVFFSYSKTLSHVSGFKEAEALVDKKIYSSIENELENSFIKEFNESK